MTAWLFAQIGSVLILGVGSAVWLAYALILACRVDDRRNGDPLVFDLARGMAIAALLWCGISVVLLIDPSFGATPLLSAQAYSIARATVLYFFGLLVGAVSFLAFRLRYLRGRHEWQRPQRQRPLDTSASAK